MDTLEFLRTILPEEGHHMVALGRSTHSGLAHKSFESLEVMAKAIETYSKNEDVTLYHACAAYKAPSFTVEVDGELKTKYRGEPNWLGAKSFWCDIDCGPQKAEAGKGYSDKMSAAKAIVGFCRGVGIPDPMIVDSGGGIHCYWPLTKMIGPNSWRRVAAALKALLAQRGVIVDPTRTADLSSVLRPVGSVNRKPGRDPRPVTARSSGTPVEPEVFANALSAAIKSAELVVPTYMKPPAGLNDDLTVHLGPQMESSAELVADKCLQVAQMRDTKGDVGYEQWRGVIGIIKHCTEGIELARKWSTERAATGHSSVDVDTRYNSWSSGPSTCDFFQRCNPDACEGCQFLGKITSPIQLGRLMPKPAEQTVTVLDNAQPTQVQVPAFPEGYSWSETDKKMYRHLESPDGLMLTHQFCETLFYPIYRVRNEDDTYSVGVRVHTPLGKTREFTFNTGLTAAPARLLEELGNKGEIMQTNNKDAPNHLTAYVRASVEALKRQADELNTMTTYGWKYDMQGFLVGDRLYHSDGTTRKVLVSGYAADFQNAFPVPRGTVDGYAHALNHVYNRPNMEPMQYAIVSGFGSILTPMGEPDYHGLPLALTGEDTGKGKTTVCHAVLYAFGLADHMAIKGDKGATVNGRYAMIAGFGSLPVLVDEVTNIQGRELSEFIYTLSNGEEKIRQTTAGGRGVRMAARANWKLSPLMTGNKDLHEELAVETANSQAEGVRLAQIRVDTFNIPKLDLGEVSSAVSQMRTNAGSAGEAFIRYVVTHLNEVWGMVQDNLSFAGKALPDQQHRKYRNHMACSLTAAQIMRNLGICEFDVDALREFAAALMQGAAEKVREANTLDPEDALASMINDLSPRVLSTVEYRDSRDARGPERTGRVTGGSPAGRYIQMGSNSKDPLAGRLYLVKQDIRQWCLRNRVDPSVLFAYAQQQGYIISLSERFTVGRGTEHTTSNLRCVVFNYAKIMDSADSALGLRKFTVHENPVATHPDDAVVSNG